MRILCREIVPRTNLIVTIPLVHVEICPPSLAQIGGNLLPSPPLCTLCLKKSSHLLTLCNFVKS